MPEIKLCFTFPNDPLTYQIASHDESRGEVCLKSIDGDCIRHEKAEFLLIVLMNQLPEIGTQVMQSLERTAMIYDLGSEIANHPCFNKGGRRRA